MMLNTVLTLCFLIPLLALYVDARKNDLAELSLSHFWYFTLIYLAAFPLRAWLLNIGQIETQVVYKGTVNSPFNSHALPLTEASLAVGLVVSFAFWFAAYFGYRTVRIQPPESLEVVDNGSSNRATLLTRSTVCHIAVLIISIAAVIYIDPLNVIGSARGYFTARAGHGALWILPELFFYSAVLFTVALIKTRPPRITGWIWCLIAATLLVSFLSMYTLFTRRLVAAIGLLFAVSVVLYTRRHWYVGLAGIFGTIYGASILDFARNLRTPVEQGFGLGAALEKTIHMISNYGFLNLFSTSFEGIEHVAQLIGKATWNQLLVGIDHGASWFFNVGGAYIPRAIWIDKPMIYGGIDQFRWLYPGYFDDGLTRIAIPISFVVDFSFAFGIPVGIMVAFFLGRFFRICQHEFWTPASSITALAISLYTFVFMFNIVRSGTVHVQSLLFVCFFCALICGPKEVVRGAMNMVRRVFVEFRREPTPDRLNGRDL